MPEKDGDDKEKSTKSVVNKKQKQMMGEEGYDIARDMGRVRPSKDKKDATTMPVSDEVKKTQKVNKGPSAFERVKKKYKGQIMDLSKVAEAFGGYIVEANGPTPNVSSQYTKTMRKNVKKGEKLLDKLKSFNDPEADKQRTDAENDPDLEKIGQKETGKKEPRKFFDAEKAKEKREKFIAGRKAYTDSKSGLKKGEPTEKGIVDYITKARDMRQGTNANTKANREAAKVIAKSSGKEYAQKIRDKYETDKDMSRRRGKNQPSYADVKAGIDAKNPTYLSPTKTMGKDGEMKNRPLPFPTRKSSYKSPVDKVLDDIRNVKKAGPEKQKEVEDKLRNIPDDPRIRIGKTSGDYIRTDPKTGQETELSPTGKTKTFGTLARRAEKAQQTTKKGALVGLAVKTMTPASAGVEAAERLRKGEKGVTASVIQALDIPVLSQAAGVYNAVQTYRRGQQATPEPQPKKEPQPKADSGGKGGGKGKKTSVATSGGKSKEPTETGGSDAADVAQLRYLGSRLPEVGAKLKKLRIPKLVGGMAGRRSAQGGGAA